MDAKTSYTSHLEIYARKQHIFPKVPEQAVSIDYLNESIIHVECCISSYVEEFTEKALTGILEHTLDNLLSHKSTENQLE